MMSLVCQVIVVLLVLVAFERPTYAYLDPGSGSMLLQVVLGGTAAVGVIVKLYWHRLRRLFGLRSTDDKR